MKINWDKLAADVATLAEAIKADMPPLMRVLAERQVDRAAAEALHAELTIARVPWESIHNDVCVPCGAVVSRDRWGSHVEFHARLNTVAAALSTAANDEQGRECKRRGHERELERLRRLEDAVAELGAGQVSSDQMISWLVKRDANAAHLPAKWPALIARLINSQDQDASPVHDVIELINGWRGMPSDRATLDAEATPEEG